VVHDVLFESVPEVVLSYYKYAKNEHADDTLRRRNPPPSGHRRLSRRCDLWAGATGDGPGRPPAEWLIAIERSSAGEKSSWDARWRDVVRGAALTLEPYDGRPEMVRKLAGEKKRLYDAYRRVWDEHTRAVAENLLAGNPPGDGERRYRFLASGTLVHRYLESKRFPIT
jgi:hypothetical protein